MPSDPGHLEATLDGTCTGPAAAIACLSGVCDTDNKCGYQNNTLACTAANGATVCRSGVCDPDNKCGYADGDGPCTKDSGDVVCRSGYCDSLGVCRPTGWCSSNLDCADPNAPACDLSTHACLGVKLSGLLVTFRARSAPGRARRVSART